MQTFLPFANFKVSAMCLDRARLGKQRIEGSQIISALRSGSITGEPPSDAPRRSGWLNHPAVRMWDGYVPALAVYTSVICREWIRRGYKSTMILPYDADYVRDDLFHGSASLPAHADDTTVVMPPWLGDEALHASYRSRLLAEDPAWYGQLGWTEDPGEEVLWPV